MRAGASIIYQATFLDGDLVGHADFLRRVDKPSALGNCSYEVIDTKLGRHAKAAYVLQLAFYGDLLASVQQAEPHEMHVVLGDRKSVPFTVSEYSRYFRRLLQRFRKSIGTPPTETYPTPCAKCSMCAWAERCEPQRIDDDSLHLVAGIRSGQVQKLEEAGVTTLKQLAKLKPTRKIPHLARAIPHQAARAGRDAAARPRDRQAAPPTHRAPGRRAARVRAAAAARRGRRVLRHGRRPAPRRRRARVPVRRLLPGRQGRLRVQALLGPHPPRGEAGVRAVHGLARPAQAQAPRPARLPLRRLRGHRAQEALEPPRHARGAARHVPARTAPGGPLQGRPRIHPRVHALVLHQGHREVLPRGARGRRADRRREHRLLRALPRDRRRVAAREDRALQRGRRRVAAVAARVAARAAPGRHALAQG